MLREALEALHPGLHRYLTPAQLDAGFARLEARLANGATLATAWLAIAELTSTIRCGHTFPNPSNQRAAVAQAVFARTPRVPFHFRWIDGRMIVTRDVSAEGAFPRGTEVLAINGTPAATILARLLPYGRADGGNVAKRVASLAPQPGERWSAFDVYYPLVFAPPPSGAWRFRVRRPGERARDSVLRVRRDTSAPPWTFAVADDGVATLAMPTWVTFNDAWDWQGFVRRAFVELDARRATALVFDLRGNEGGTGVGDLILAHLVARDVTLDGLRRFVRYRQVPPALRPVLDTWDRSFDDWGDAATPAPERPGFYRLVRAGDDGAGTVVRAAAPRFAGRDAELAAVRAVR